MLEVIDKIIEGAKKAKDVAQRIRNAELQSTIADLMLNLADLKTEMADLRAENLTLRNKVQALEKQVDIRSKIVMKNDLYYLSESIPGYADGPFCTRCYDCSRQLVKMMGPGWQPGRKGGIGTFQAPDGTAWTCPECIRITRPQ